MKLYYNPGSGPCRRVLATAAHLSIPFESHEINFMDPNDKNMKEMHALDPVGRMPLLVDGDFVLGESNAIMQYLCSKKVGSTLFPEDAKSRAEVLRWQFFTVAHLGQATGTVMYENLFKKLFEKTEPDQAALAEGLEEFAEHASALDQHLKGRKYFVGNSVTLADFSMGSALMYWEPSGLPFTKYANFYAWYQNLETVKAWKDTTPNFKF